MKHSIIELCKYIRKNVLWVLFSDNINVKMNDIAFCYVCDHSAPLKSYPQAIFSFMPGIPHIWGYVKDNNTEMQLYCILSPRNIFFCFVKAETKNWYISGCECSSKKNFNVSKTISSLSNLRNILRYMGIAYIGQNPHLLRLVKEVLAEQKEQNQLQM